MTATDQALKPAALPVQVENVPAELRALNQWVLWRWELRDGKWTKPPHTPAGGYAKSTDPATWSTFDVVVEAYEAGAFDGIGIAVTDDDDIVGVDLDHCFDDDGIAKWAAEAIRELDTYTEVSPSGTGIRLIALGRLPAGARKRGNVEMYETGRYLTITGQTNELVPVTQRAAQLKAFHKRWLAPPPSETKVAPPRDPSTLSDAEVLDLARGARNGSKLDVIYRGDDSRHNGDTSVADLALCSMLAFYTQDPGQLDRLFRGSGRMRPKWDERHTSTGATYGEMTVDKALSQLGDTYTPGDRDSTSAPKLTVLDADTRVSASDEEPDEDTIILRSWRPVDLTDAIAGNKTRPAPSILRRSDGRTLFYEGQINYLHGADGVGKSFVALFAAVEVVNDGGHVVWLDWEDPDETTVVARLLDLGVARDVIAKRFQYLHPETESTDLAVALVADLVRQTGARLCVLDSVGEALGIDGVNEDKDAEVTPWMRRVLRPLARAGAAVLPIDHGIKSGDNPLHPSGSKRKRAQVTGAHYLVESPRPISQEYGGGTLKLTCAKDRHGNFTRGKPAAVIDVGIYPDGGWTAHVHPPEIVAAGDNDKTLARAIVRVVKELGEEMGSPPNKNQVETSSRVKASVTKKRAAIDYAEALGCIRTEPGGPGRPTLCIYLKDLEP